MTRSSSGLGVLVLGIISILYGWISFKQHYTDRTVYQTSYFRSAEGPAFVPVSFNSSRSNPPNDYRVYLYREVGISPEYQGPEDSQALGGTPVLYIPGNAGSFKQGQALASEASILTEYDWFLADFNGELSAMQGQAILEEASFINDAIAAILALYAPHKGLAKKPSSVILIGHSMGGFVARALCTLENYTPQSVNTIITLSTAHTYPPLTFDKDMVALYRSVNQHWRHNDSFEDTLLSISGGHTDLMVPPHLTIAESLGGLTVFTYEVPDVGFGVSHGAINWCVELKGKIVDAIAAVHDSQQSSRTLPRASRMQRLRESLKAPFKPGVPTLELGRLLLLGGKQTIAVDKDTVLVLPSQSSIVGYTVKSDRPVQIAHETEYEYRSYGETDHAEVVWYSSGPFTPLKLGADPRLRLRLSPSARTQVKVSISWSITIANAVVHYRSFAASFPLSIVLLTVFTMSSRKLGFASAYISFMGHGFLKASVALIVVHLGLTFFPSFQQKANEYLTADDLESVGYTASELLLGIRDPELFWLLPVFLATACCAVGAVQLLSYSIRWLVLKLLSGRTETLTRKWHWPLLLSAYFFPYQVTTIAIALIQLSCVRDTSAFEYGISQLLLWTAIIDAPAAALYLQRLDVYRFWHSAGFVNVLDTLPLIGLIGTAFKLRGHVLHVVLQLLVASVAGVCVALGGVETSLPRGLLRCLFTFFCVTSFLDG